MHLFLHLSVHGLTNTSPHTPPVCVDLITGGCLRRAFFPFFPRAAAVWRLPVLTAASRWKTQCLHPTGRPQEINSNHSMLMHTHIVSAARYYSQGAYCLSGALAACAPERVAGCVSRMFGAGFIFSVAFLDFAWGAMRHGPTLAGRLKSCRRNDKDGATGSFGNFEAKRKKMKCLKLPTGSQVK